MTPLGVDAVAVARSFSASANVEAAVVATDFVSPAPAAILS